jgi:hypothetical protein
MKQWDRKALLGMLVGMGSAASLTAVQLAAAQLDPQLPKPQGEEPPKRLPDGTLQSEAILKAEHKRNLEEVARLIALAQEIEGEFKKFDHHVLSVGMLKKLDEIERLAKRIRSRQSR